MTELVSLCYNVEPSLGFLVFVNKKIDSVLLLIICILPGQGDVVEHVLVSTVPVPEHCLPSYLGAGLVQERVRDVVPLLLVEVVHVTEHVAQLAQSVH